MRPRGHLWPLVSFWWPLTGWHMHVYSRHFYLKWIYSPTCHNVTACKFKYYALPSKIAGLMDAASNCRALIQLCLNFAAYRIKSILFRLNYICIATMYIVYWNGPKCIVILRCWPMIFSTLARAPCLQCSIPRVTWRPLPYKILGHIHCSEYYAPQQIW